MQKFRLSTLRAFVLLLLTATLAVIVLRWISLERWHWEWMREATTEKLSPEETAAVEPSPTPARSAVIPQKKLEVPRLFNEITLHATVEPTPGADATTERADPQSYVLDLKLLARVPSPNKTLDELAKVNPELPKLLPGLAAMISPESVSPYFADLYNTKLKMLHENLNRLDLLLSRHNFYDCQTVLQFRHPQTHRRAVLLQADMDVDADGSDSDRLPMGSGAPTNFKPFTSYRWPKKTSAPNPYLPPTEEKLRQAELEYGQKTIAPERKRELRGTIGRLHDEVDSLKKFSFLIGATDPYIVLPGGFARADGGKVGDYAVVIFGNGIYPALVGDIGPADKVGEASLRIAKEINPATTPYNRPVSDLKVTYLIFPGTAEPKSAPPDLEKIQARCETLVNEIGGASVPLHHWENILPTPTPTATPSATPSPSPAPTSTVSPTPGESAAPSATLTPAATFAFPIATPRSTP